MPFDVFISHSHQDKAVADAACSALEAAGIRCWIAPRDVMPGSTWAESVVNAIDSCRAMVLIFSSGANQSKQIYREVERAFEKEVPVIPLRIENVVPEHSLAYYMGPVHWLDALTPPLEGHLKHLVSSVAALLDPGKALEKPAAPTDNAVSSSAPHRSERVIEKPKSHERLKWIVIGFGMSCVAIAVAAGLWFLLHKPTTTVATPTASPTAPTSPTVNCTSPICGNWQGSGFTSTVQFGGAPYCTYSVTLQDLALSAAVDPNGHVTSAGLTLNMVEGTVGSCSLLPLGTKPHSYSGSGTTNGIQVNLALNPNPQNKPQASAAFSGVVTNGRLVGTITVHRIDTAGNLAWTVISSTQ